MQFSSHSTIRNTEAKLSQAVCQVATNRRVCLTGTPVQNNVQDILSLLSFLCIGAEDEHGDWPTTLLPHLKTGNFQPIQTVLRHTTLRRTKQDELLHLPEITHKIILTPLSPAAEDFYFRLHDAFFARMQNELPQDESRPIKTSLLKDIGELCGACSHPVLANPHVKLDRAGRFVIREPDINPNQVVSSRSETIVQYIDTETCLQSSKIKTLLGMIQPGSPIVAGGSKVVIFSCWTRFLDL